MGSGTAIPSSRSQIAGAWTLVGPSVILPDLLIAAPRQPMHPRLLTTNAPALHGAERAARVGHDIAPSRRAAKPAYAGRATLPADPVPQRAHADAPRRARVRANEKQALVTPVATPGALHFTLEALSRQRSAARRAGPERDACLVALQSQASANAHALRDLLRDANGVRAASKAAAAAIGPAATFVASRTAAVNALRTEDPLLTTGPGCGPPPHVTATASAPPLLAADERRRR